MENENTMKDMMPSKYGNEQLDKSNELNETMSIVPSGADEYENKIHSLGGNQ